MTVRVRWWGLAFLALGAAAAVAALVHVPRPEAAGGVPTSRVTRGTIRLDVRSTGELRTARMATMVAPPTGGTLRLVHLVPTGGELRAGDVVMEFDPTQQQYALDQARSQLAEADQELIKMRADVEVQAAQDQVNLLTARFDVRRAELDTRTPAHLISGVDAKKRALALEEAQRRLAQIEEDVRSRATTSQAALAVVEEKRTKARLAADRARQTIDSLVVRAPLDGLVVAKENRDVTNVFFSGMTLPMYREGDSVFAGRAVADVFATGEMLVRIKVNEQERSNVAVGQRATVVCDMMPGLEFAARVASTAGMATRAGMFDGAIGPLRQFDVSLAIDTPDRRLRPGTSVRVVIAGEEIRDALSVPRQALFQRNGKLMVYVRADRGFQPREVKVTHRTESRVVCEGVAEGTEVALADPEAGAAGSSSAPAAQVPASGGPR